MTPIARPPNSGSEAVSMPIADRRRLSAEKAREQAVLHEDREAEGDQQRRQDVVAEHAVEQAGLQP